MSPVLPTGRHTKMSVCRQLFPDQPIDREELCRFNRDLEEKLSQRDANKWGFDFKKDEPLNHSRWQWSKVGEKADQEIPKAYDLPHLTLRVSMKRALVHHTPKGQQNSPSNSFDAEMVTPGLAGAVVTPGLAGAVVTPGLAGAVTTPGLSGAVDTQVDTGSSSEDEVRLGLCQDLTDGLHRGCCTPVPTTSIPAENLQQTTKCQQPSSSIPHKQGIKRKQTVIKGESFWHSRPPYF